MGMMWLERNTAGLALRLGGLHVMLGSVPGQELLERVLWVSWLGWWGLRVRLGHLVAVHALPPDPGDVSPYTRPEYSVTGPCFHPINALVSSMEQVEYVCAETDWNDNTFRHHQNSVLLIK